MRKLILLPLLLLCGYSLKAQMIPEFDISMMTQTVAIYNISVPPAADKIKARSMLPGGGLAYDYENGTRVILHANNKVEKLSKDRKVKQVFVFADNKTELVQYYRTGRSTIVTTFVETDRGDMVAKDSREVFDY